MKWHLLPVIGIIFNQNAISQEDNLNWFQAANAGFNKTKGQLAALGDVNADKFLDVFLLNQDQKGVSVHVWNEKDKQFARQDGIFKYSSSRIITNVIAADFEAKGSLQLLFVTEPQDSTQNAYDLMMVYPDGTTKPLKSIKVGGAPPLVLNVTSDLKPSIVGKFKDGNDTIGLETGDMGFAPCEPIPDGLSSAFLDLDGDCAADLILQCKATKTFQVWTNSKDTFVKSTEMTLPTPPEHEDLEQGPISYADVDGDGAIDMLYFECHSSKGTGWWWDNKKRDCKLVIAYNQQLGLCKGGGGFWAALGFSTETTGDYCRPKSKLCMKDRNFGFDMENGTTLRRIPLGELLSTEDPEFKADFLPDLSIPIKVGDFNLDGYPDLVYIAVPGNSRSAHILLSVPDKSSENHRHFHRTFKHGTELFLDSPSGSVRVSVFDYKENGNLDVAVSMSDGRISIWENTWVRDAFFLKTLSSNAVAKEDGSKAYGVNLPGATFKFVVLDAAGGLRLMQKTQLSQTHAHALQAPYAFFGLGRTNNYVEELHVGLPGLSKLTDQSRLASWAGIIPNSQLVMFPYDLADPNTWSIELFVSPSAYTKLVFIVVTVCMTILAVVISVLHIMERREDQRERRVMMDSLHMDRL